MARLAYMYYLMSEEALEQKDERKRHRQKMRRNFAISRIPDREFVSKYRLSRELFEALCADLVPLLPQRIRTTGVDSRHKVLSALNFYAWGSFQGAVGLSKDVPMAQTTVSRCLREVTNALNEPSILRKYFRFPQNLAERKVLKRGFYNKYGLPGAIGCIDCTHVALLKPRDNDMRCLNKKNYHSLNVQIICDADSNILNVDATYGGQTEGDHIWSRHEIKQHMESLQKRETVFLLGDSAYSQREYLMTPVENAAEGSPEERYNTIHKRAYSSMEQTLGTLKGRWRCLLAAKELHYAPDIAGKIIIACCGLHNICNRAGIEPPSLTEEELLQERSRQIYYDTISNDQV